MMFSLKEYIKNKCNSIDRFVCKIISLMAKMLQNLQNHNIERNIFTGDVFGTFLSLS